MNEWGMNFLAALFRSTLMMSISAVLVMSFLRLFQVTSPSLRRLACVVVILQGCLLMQVPVTLPVGVDQFASQIPAFGSVPSPPQRGRGGQKISGLEEAQPSFVSDAIPDEPISISTTEIPVTVSRRPIPWALGLVFCWGAGIAVLSFRYVGKYCFFLRYLPRMQESSAEWATEWDTLQKQVGIQTPVPLQVVPQIGPLLCWHPRGHRLIVPAELWNSLTPEQRLPILQHELAHLLRRDIGKSLAIRLLALPQWFNPLVWRLAKHFDDCAEWACDEAVRQAGSDQVTEYARTLLQLGEMSALPLLATSAMASGNGLAIRIRRLLVTHPHKDSTMKKLTVATIVLGLLALQVIRFQVRAEETPAKAAAEQQPVKDVHASGSVNVRQNLDSSAIELTADRLVLFTDFAKPVVAVAETPPAGETTSQDVLLEIQGGATLTLDGTGNLVVDTAAKRTEAVIDIRHLMAQAAPFQQDREKFKADIAKQEEKMKLLQQELQAMQEKYKNLVQKSDGDTEVVRAYQVIFKEKKNQYEAERKAAQSELLWKETEMHLAMYERVVAEVTAYAKEHGIRVVRRKNSNQVTGYGIASGVATANAKSPEAALALKKEAAAAKLAAKKGSTMTGISSNRDDSPATPSQLLQKIMEKEIIYAEAESEFDITEEILKRLNAKFVEEKGILGDPTKS